MAHSLVAIWLHVSVLVINSDQMADMAYVMLHNWRDWWPPLMTFWPLTE